MSIKDLIVLNIFVFILLVSYKFDNYDMAFAIMFFITVFYIVKSFTLNLFLKKEIANQKKYFVETLIHDLKVPTLAQLRGLELIQKETVGSINNTQKELIKQIEESCKYSLDMISMLLNTYRFENGQNRLYYETFDLIDVLKNCIEEISNLAKEKNITFSYDETQNNTTIEADKAEIKKVISNLISNAITYSNKDEKINVNISTINNQLKFTIKSRGITFTKRECLTMFDKANAPKYTTIGQRIKLYLCKKIIDGHCGKIYASTDGITSNTFTFVLPITRAINSSKLCSPSFI